MIEIELTRGCIAIVDDIDSDLRNAKWHSKRAGMAYAYRASNYGGSRREPCMHRVILSRMLNRPLESSEYVDHIDGNGLNNRRSNLRLSSGSQNGANRAKTRSNKSGYKGVSWDKNHQKWQSQIKINRKNIYLGRFDNVKDAARAYNGAALKYQGQFARLNIIEDESHE